MPQKRNPAPLAGGNRASKRIEAAKLDGLEDTPHPRERQTSSLKTASLAVEIASNSDRKFFEQHPDCRFRLRRVIEGEWGPLAVATEWVMVENVIPGRMRIRHPVSVTPTSTAKMQ
jgi:hypothetical protein